jgi:hypothetical protein
VALVFGHGGQEGDKAAAGERGEIEVGLVEDLDQRPASVDALDQIDAVEHGAGCSIPFGNDEDVTSAEFVDGLLKFGAALDGLARTFSR